MSYEATLQRISDLQARLGVGVRAAAGQTATAVPGAFDAQLAAQQAAINGEGGAAAPGAESPFSQYGVPVLTVDQQKAMLGLGGQFAPSIGGSVGARMVELATKELGVSETGGNNESTRIREYRGATAGAENTPGPWCAYFVSWLAKEAGAPIGTGGNGTGYVPTLEAWGKQQDRFTKFGAGTPQPGDIVIFNWGGSGVADHTGIVERVDADGTIHTIEGNTSDAVRRRTYPGSTDDISGYVRMS